MRILLIALLSLVGLFLLASILEKPRMAGVLAFTIGMLLLTILILARFGGDLGRTL